MKKYLVWILAAVLLTAITVPVIVYAYDISDAVYVGTIQISNNGTAAADVSTVMTLESASFKSVYNIDDAWDYVALVSSTGAAVRFMPGYGANPWCIFVPSIAGSQILTDLIYAGYTDLACDKSWFPGTTGGTVPDGMTEPTDNFSLKLNDTFLNTSASDNIVYKQDALLWQTSSGNSGSVYARIPSTNALDFEATNTDYVTGVDNDKFSFTDGAGNDTKFTITGWCKPETLGIEYFASKARTATTYEWWFGHHSSGNVSMGIVNTNASAYILKYGNISVSTGTWYHVACTYDGSETAAGIKLYLNGSLITTTSVTTAGVYTGMTNTNSEVEFGRILGAGAAMAYYDGVLSNFKIYKGVEFTASQILEDYNYDYINSTYLSGWYKFIDGAGNPVDSSGNGFNTTANTADWVATGGKANLSSVQATGVTPAEYDLKLSANSTNMTLYLNGVAQSSFAIGTGVPDNANNWTFGSSSATPYIGEIVYTKGGNPVDTWTWEYATTFIGIPTGNILTPTFRTTSSDADVSAVLITFSPISTANPPAFSLSDAPDFVTGNSTMEGQFTSGNVSSTGGPPGFSFISEIANAGSVPNIWLFGIIATCIVTAGHFFWIWMQRRYGFRSMWPFFLTGAAVLGLLIALGGTVKVFDFWMMFFFAMIFICLMVMSRHTEVGGAVSQHGLIGFAAQSFIGLTLINRVLGGAFVGSSDTTWVNNFAFTQEFKAFDMFSVPVMNTDFWTTGIPSLFRWDYSFFGGNAQCFQYLLYALTAVLAFVMFTMLIGLLYNLFK